MSSGVLWLVVLAVVLVGIVQGNDVPVVTVSPTTYSLPENTDPDTTIAQVTVSDDDADNEGEVSCTMLGGGKFDLKAVANEAKKYDIVTKTPYNFEDPELASQIGLTVKCADNGSPKLTGSAQFTVIVTDVNEAPSITNPAEDNEEFTVNTGKDLASQTFMVEASDPDGTDSDNGQLEYSFKNAGAVSELFKIETGNGAATITPKKIPTDDAEQTVTVIAKDKAASPLSAERIMKFVYSSGQVSFNNLFANLLLVSIVNILYFML